MCLNDMCVLALFSRRGSIHAYLCVHLLKGRVELLPPPRTCVDCVEPGSYPSFTSLDLGQDCDKPLSPPREQRTNQLLFEL